MVKDDSDRLSVLRDELRRRLGAERYELWLGAQTALTLEAGELRVQGASPAEANWLRRNLSAVLTESVAVVCKAPLPIVYLSAEGAQGVDGAAAGSGEAARNKEVGPTFGSQTPRRQRELAWEAGGSEVSASQAPTAQASPPTKRPRQTFDDFIVGAGNRLASQAAREVAQQPGRFSPLLVYGPSGSGKSHLLNAVAVHARAARNRPRVMPLTAEQFTSQFLEALERRALPGFRQKMRSLDVLLIDDVQFLVGKKATLEELLYTIDALHARGGQVVLASDRSAADLASMSAEFASRLSSGLGVALDPPDYASRVGIVQVMAQRMQLRLETPVVELIAQQVVGSARLLAGAINRLVATSMALGKPIGVELASMALAEFCRQHSPQVRLADIQRAVCEVFGVESSSLKSPRKTRAVAEPRMLAMWLARRYTRAALSEIGDFFGRRSHSTVVSAQRKFDALISRHGEIVVGDQVCKVEEAIRRIETKLRTA